MAKKYVPIFFDWTETTIDLTQEQKGNLIDAVVDYASDRRSAEEITKQLTAIERVAFRFLKGQVDRNDDISAARSRAGSNKLQQTATNDNKPQQTATNKEESKERTQEMFARFWKAYPRHEAKAVALKAFEKLKPTETLLQTMIAAIEKQKNSAQWKENGGQYIPHPSTWLNQKRWEDEVQQNTAGTVAAQKYSQRDYSGEQDEALKRRLKMQEGA